MLDHNFFNRLVLHGLNLIGLLILNVDDFGINFKLLLSWWACNYLLLLASIDIGVSRWAGWKLLDLLFFVGLMAQVLHFTVLIIKITKNLAFFFSLASVRGRSIFLIFLVNEQLVLTVGRAGDCVLDYLLDVVLLDFTYLRDSVRVNKERLIVDWSVRNLTEETEQTILVSVFIMVCS